MPDQNEETPKPSRRPAAEAGDAGQAEVTQRVEEENARGYRGETPDPTPNENYTVKGVTSGAPTPETDPELRAKVRENL